MSKSLNRDAVVSLVVLLLGLASPLVASEKWPIETAMEATFEVSPGGELRVEVPDADLELKTGSSNRVSIEVTLGGRDLDRARAVFEKMDFRASASDGGVNLEADAIRTAWFSTHRGGYSITVTIELPERFDIDLRTSDGDISLESLDGSLSLKSSDGDIVIGRLQTSRAKVATSDGDIEIREIVATSLVELHTSDGDVLIDTADGGEIEIRTSDGDIEVRELSGALNARSGDGDISIGADRFDDTSLSTNDGDITIRLADGAGADVDVRGEEIIVRSGLRLEGTRSDGSARGTINGGGSKLEASSGDGTVTITSR